MTLGRHFGMKGTAFAAAMLLVSGCASDHVAAGGGSGGQQQPRKEEQRPRGGLTTGDLTEAARLGMILAGKEEEADRLGQATGNVTGAFTTVPLESEIAIGEAIAASTFDNVGRRHPDEELQRYVNLVGRTIARSATRPEVPYRFAVVESPQINAFSGPGGFIMVTTGLLRNVDTEAELAGILAHEIAHVTGRHMLRTMRRAQFMDGILQGAAALDGNVSQYGQAVDDGNDILFNRGFDQNMEFEADAAGTRLAAASGYDAAGLRDFLGRLAGMSETGGWFQTHPNAASRVRKLDRILQTEFSGMRGASNPDRFRRAVAGLDGASSDAMPPRPAPRPADVEGTPTPAPRPGEKPAKPGSSAESSPWRIIKPTPSPTPGKGRF